MPQPSYNPLMATLSTARAAVQRFAHAPSIAAICLLALLAACSNRVPSTSTGILRVVATIPPAQGIIEPLLRGAGLKYELTTLLPPGSSEHGFEISPEKMAALGKADVVVMIGLGMEPQVEKFLAQHPSKERHVIILGDSVKEPLPDTDDDHDDHHHSADPHAWLDPIIVQSMLFNCSAILKAAVPASADRIESSRAEVAKRVVGVHDDYLFAIGRSTRNTIIVAHDAYGYLAKRYKLEVIAITGLNAGEPQPADVKKAADAIRDKRLTTIFVEPQLSPAAAERIAQATGAKTAVLDPLGDGDWFKLMDKNLAALKAALGSAAPDKAP